MSLRIICGTQVSHKVEDASQVGECRRAAQRLAETFGFNETCAARAGIVATELANNLLRHAGGGELLIQGLDDTRMLDRACDNLPRIRPRQTHQGQIVGLRRRKRCLLQVSG